mmetsp:Transcript_55867/g.149001  ORF Transcript_55867/g.149001 Transcript_55867/m.149001 type:complete len:135 (-) Transcript_55867:32-436(-)
MADLTLPIGKRTLADVLFPVSAPQAESKMSGRVFARHISLPATGETSMVSAISCAGHPNQKMGVRRTATLPVFSQGLDAKIIAPLSSAATSEPCGDPFMTHRASPGSCYPTLFFGNAPCDGSVRQTPNCFHMPR